MAEATGPAPAARAAVNPLRGIGLKVLSVTVFTAMAICIKLAAPEVPPGQAVFFRSVFAIPVILVWLVWSHNLGHGLETTNPMGHLWRGLVGTTAMGLGFTALGLLPLPEVIALGYAAPLLTVIFAASTLQTVGAMAALLGAVFAALAQVFVRKLVHSEATAAIVFYFSLTASILSLATLPFGWIVPDLRQTALLVGAGLLGGVGQILLTESYRHAETSVIAPFEYVSMVLALVLGYLVFEEIPTETMLGGASLIVAAGLFIIWREHQLGLERAKARRVITPQG